MTTKEYNSLLDENWLVLIVSPSGLKHVRGWYGQAQCGSFEGENWDYHGLTNLRTLGRMSRRPDANRMCKRCANQYKDVSE